MKPTSTFCIHLIPRSECPNPACHRTPIEAEYLECSVSMALLIGWARRRLETQEELDLQSLRGSFKEYGPSNPLFGKKEKDD